MIVWIIYLGCMIAPQALYGLLGFCIFVPLSLIANKIMGKTLAESSIIRDRRCTCVT